MKLKKFIKKFIERNTIIRLVYKDGGGHKVVLDSFEDVCMEWKTLKGEGKYKDYLNHKVVGITDILTYRNFSQAINIVIEEK